MPERIEVDCAMCGGQGFERIVVAQDWVEDHRTPERLFADFLNVNLDEVERERREMLDRIREVNRGEAGDAA